MRRALIAFGTLGGGTVVAFVLAALAFLAAPDGHLVPATNWPVPVVRGGPVPEPAILVDPSVPQRLPAIAQDGIVGIGTAPALPVDIDPKLAEELARSGGG